jgi:two-component system invasion response regulator UvrY
VITEIEFEPVRLTAPSGKRLSPREVQVLSALARGDYPAVIAKDLALSVKTVSTYRDRILKKMQMRSNAQLAVWAYRNGLIQAS